MDILRYVQLLRSMELSIDDIKLIIDGKLSLRKALESKKDYIERERVELETIEKRINDYIKRRKVYVSFDDERMEVFRKVWADEVIGYLYFNENHIRYGDTFIDLNDVEYINISICSYSNVFAMNTSGRGYEFHLDLDVHFKDDVYTFEVFNYKVNPRIFKYFDNHNIKIDDPINLKELYTSKHIVEASRYLQYNFKKIAKKYNLDNPRGNFFQEHYSICKKNSEKTISVSKNIFHNLVKREK